MLEVKAATLKFANGEISSLFLTHLYFFYQFDYCIKVVCMCLSACIGMLISVNLIFVDFSSLPFI